MSFSTKKTVLLASMVVAVGSAYAATVNNPGAIAFSGNVDSKITSYGGGGNMFLNNGNMTIPGSLDSNGDSFFDLLDIVFDANEDANGYRTQLQAIDDATGTYCPNSKHATINLAARIRVTKVAGTSITSTPCFISINGGSAFTLTTGTSGSLTGAAFSAAEPKLVAETTLGSLVTGTCTTTQKNTIATYYGLGSASIEIFVATISPTNFSGDGC